MDQTSMIIAGAVGLVLLVLALIVIKRLRRKPKTTKKKAGKPSTPKPRKLPTAATAKDQVAEVVKVDLPGMYAYLKAPGGKDVFLDLHLATRSGLKSVKVGDRLRVSFGDSREKSKRLDVLTVTAA